MKKQFKRLIPFLLAALIAWPAWALTIQGGNGSAIQDGNATIQGSRWTPLKISNLVAWYDARVLSSFTFNGPGADLIDEDFTTDPGWTENSQRGSIFVTGGQIVALLDDPLSGTCMFHSPTYTAQTEVWTAWDFSWTGTVPSGLSFQGSGASTGTSTQHILEVGIKNDGGERWSITQGLDSGSTVTTVALSVHTPQQGVTYRISTQWVAATGVGQNDGIVRVWIDKLLILEILTRDTDTLTATNFKAGSLFTSANVPVTVFIDNVKVGSTGTSPAQISQWNDLSGNGNHLLQTTAVDQPVYDSATQKLTFDGVSENLQTSAFADGDISQPITIIVTAREIGDVNGVFDLFDGILVSKRVLLRLSTTKWAIFAGTGPISGSATRDTTIHTFLSEFNTTSSKMFLDGGSADISGDAGTNVMSGLTLAAGYNGTSELFNGEFSELIVYDKLLSTGEKNQIGNYLAAKYGITWTEIP